MKNLYIIACLIAALFLGACGASDEPAYDTSLSPANATKPVTPLTIADTLLSDTTRSSAALTATPAIISNAQAVPSQSKPAVISQSQPSVIKGGAGLNPAHGLPGHRCDIAVGAPLNSPPSSTPQPVVQSSTPTISSTPAIQKQPISVPAVNASPGNSTGKINPAHGQPGHDCAVPVGQPLKN